jgi:glycosyltransferase involved in cell wall biosynthesis
MVSILYLTPNPNRASSNVPTEGWFRILRERGLKPVVVVGSEGEFSRWTRRQGIPTHVLPLVPPDKWRPWNYMRLLMRLRRISVAAGVEVVHSIEHTVHPIAADLARWCRLPVVVGVHCRIARGFGEWAFGGRRQPDRIFFLSRGSRAVCHAAVDGVILEERWRLLPNGLDLDWYRPDPALGEQFREQHQLGQGLLVGAATWLRPGKQIEHLCTLRNVLDACNCRLLIAGGFAPGEEEYARGILAAAETALGDRLRFLGCLSDLRGFYNALDATINVSKEETCSISVIESLACGCPVIGYPSVSVDEQILPDGGEIVPQDNVEQLANALGRWLADPNALASKRIAARKQAERRFDIQKLSEGLWDEYVAVLAERGRVVRKSAEPVVELQSC